ERDPQRRYQTMQAFVRALEATVAPRNRAASRDEAPDLFTGTLELPRPRLDASPASEPIARRRSLRFGRGAQGAAALGLVALVTAALNLGRRSADSSNERVRTPQSNGTHQQAPTVTAPERSAIPPERPGDASGEALVSKPGKQPPGL